VTPARLGAGVEVAVAALLWAAVVVGSAVLALTVPVYTSFASRSVAVASTAGLPATDVFRLSQNVRALVADRQYDPLPATWAGQPAFDRGAVSHLLDVRRVISAARTATGAAALLLAAYAGYCIARRRLARFSGGMKAGAAMVCALMLLAVAASFLDFEALFTAFHGLFFAAGTWTFPADSLLIRLFPERFWMASGAAWAALSVTGALVLVGAARFVRGAEARLSASRTAHNV